MAAELRSGVSKGEMSSKTTFQRSAKGPCAISESSAEGKFIILENTGRKVAAAFALSSHTLQPHHSHTTRSHRNCLCHRSHNHSALVVTHSPLAYEVVYVIIIVCKIITLSTRSIA